MTTRVLVTMDNEMGNDNDDDDDDDDSANTNVRK